MAFTITNIDSDTARYTAGWGYLNGHLVRDPDNGILWAFFADDGGRFYYARWSNDEGASWSSEETIWDRGSTSATIFPLCGTFGIAGGEPAVVILDGTTARPFLRSGGTWGAGGTLTIASQETGIALMQASDASWHFIWMKTNGSNKDELQHSKSTDDMGSWTAAYKTHEFYSNSGLFASYQQSSSCATMDEDDNIHAVVGGNGGSGNYHVMYALYDAGMDSWSHETIHDTGAGDGLNKPSSLGIVVDGDNYPHVLWQARSASHSQYQSQYSNKRSGSWVAREFCRNGVEAAVQSFSVLGVMNDGTALACMATSGYGTNSGNVNIQLWSRDPGTGVWSRTGITDSATTHDPEGIDCGGASDAQRPDVGFALMYNVGAVMKVAVDDDIEWGDAGGGGSTPADFARGFFGA